MFVYDLVNNTAVKIIFLVGFFIFFYSVMFKIGVFFGVDYIELLMYMGWLGFLLILATFLPFRYGILDKIVDPPKPSGVVNPVTGLPNAPAVAPSSDGTP